MGSLHNPLNDALISFVDDYQCLDPSATRPSALGPTNCEAYYQTSHSAGRYDPGGYPVITTAVRPHNTLPRLPDYATNELDPNAVDLIEDDATDSGSLELMKHPFPESDNYAHAARQNQPQAVVKANNSSSTALARSRTLNFPKATFV